MSERKNDVSRPATLESDLRMMVSMAESSLASKSTELRNVLYNIADEVKGQIRSLEDSDGVLPSCTIGMTIGDRSVRADALRAEIHQVKDSIRNLHQLLARNEVRRSEANDG